MNKLLVCKSNIIIAISAFLILSNYYYIYFYSFDQGVSGAGSAFNMLRFISIGMLFSQLFKPVISLKCTQSQLFLLAFCLAVVMFVLVKMTVYYQGNLMIANMLMCAIPIAMLKPHEETRRFWFFFDCCLYILTLQVVADWIICLLDMSVWDNNAFIGGLGNPSSFGIICCVFLAYTLFMKPKGIKNLLIASALALGALKTGSLLPSILVGVITIFSLMVRPRADIILMGIVFATVLSIGPTSVSSGHTMYKLSSVFESLSGAPAKNVSQSISLRESIHKNYFENVTTNTAKAILIGDQDQYYFGVDSQVITYLSSFGMIISMAFLLYAVSFGANALFAPIHCRYFFMSVFVIFSAAFLFNRILDYYPMALFFFLSARMATFERAKPVTVSLARSYTR